MRHPQFGRYSFLAADPIEVLTVPVGSENPLAILQVRLARDATLALPNRPPFQGGWAGCLSYELGRSFEQLPESVPSPIAIPAVTLALYDVVVAWDHVLEECWIFSQGLPETDIARREKRARERAEEILRALMTESANIKTLLIDGDQPKPLSQLSPVPPNFEVVAEGCFSNFTKAAYHAAVERCVNYIRAGDIFQVNLSQQLLVRQTSSACDLFERLAETNPSTFSGYFDAGDFQVISSSPERLLQIRNRHLESRPIKGTRRRTRNAVVDEVVSQELTTNEKERAENTMIVDLMRNDFSRICTDESVLVSEWCQLESYETVYHLVSAIEGTLRPDVHVTEAISAIFPGGSVTGAPKIRAMEIITELEGVSRGAYCGSLGYFALSGDADFNILIRTVTAQNGWWQIPVGGAVVAQSSPEQEYQETWTKAAAVLDACLPSGLSEVRPHLLNTEQIEHEVILPDEQEPVLTPSDQEVVP